MNVTLKEKYGLYINGQWKEASDKGTFETTNPDHRKTSGLLRQATKEDVDEAVRAAWAAYPGWKAVEPSKRADILLKIADRIDENKELLATVESMDNGKPSGRPWPLMCHTPRITSGSSSGAIRTEEAPPACWTAIS